MQCVEGGVHSTHCIARDGRDCPTSRRQVCKPLYKCTRLDEYSRPTEFRRAMQCVEGGVHSTHCIARDGRDCPTSRRQVCKPLNG
ncbi:unnamed protein product [Nippostrongylus brasiliensis]|uniref:EGF-like domain-containing protein n=1 Tax=Nippostrongylus brasiliensis TaxID=27835 RepID=A0A0N4XW21_NIPBR|nr:unnamed protein product [Nippostrongylus brasiliensis]